MIIPKRAERMREIIAERRMSHCGNFRMVDKRLGGKERQYFEEKEREREGGEVLGI